MRVALGILGWTPEVFWSSTTDEFLAALEGWEQANGIESSPEPLTRDELDSLMERFPDELPSAKADGF